MITEGKETNTQGKEAWMDELDNQLVVAVSGWEIILYLIRIIKT